MEKFDTISHPPFLRFERFELNDMSGYFDNGEKCYDSKLYAGVHTMPQQFENGREFDGK